MPRPFMIILLNTDHKTFLCLHCSVSLYDHTESYLILWYHSSFFLGGWSPSGDGSKPTNTIFRGMNIHLPLF